MVDEPPRFRDATPPLSGFSIARNVTIQEYPVEASLRSAPALSVTMIVRDEADRLPPTLEAVARFLSGFVVRGRFLYDWRGLVHDLIEAAGTLQACVRLWHLDRLR